MEQELMRFQSNLSILFVKYWLKITARDNGNSRKKTYKANIFEKLIYDSVLRLTRYFNVNKEQLHFPMRKSVFSGNPLIKNSLFVPTSADTFAFLHDSRCRPGCPGGVPKFPEMKRFDWWKDYKLARSLVNFRARDWKGKFPFFE